VQFNNSIQPTCLQHAAYFKRLAGITMTTLPSSFAQFKMSEGQDASFRQDFPKVFLQIDLSRPDSEPIKRIIANYQVPGIYFWVMRYGDAADLYPIYIGKAKSLSYRVQNYVSKFQPHSPNDYKLLIFQEFLAEAVPTAALDLLFAPKSADQLTHAENEAIRVYTPLLNRRLPASADARLGLQRAFKEFYRSASL
jgi:hypothetical protein